MLSRTFAVLGDVRRLEREMTKLTGAMEQTYAVRVKDPLARCDERPRELRARQYQYMHSHMATKEQHITVQGYDNTAGVQR